MATYTLTVHTTITLPLRAHSKSQAQQIADELVANNLVSFIEYAEMYSPDGEDDHTEVEYEVD